LSTWLWLALLTYRELTVATFLSSTNSITLPVVIWSAWQSGIGQSAAGAILAFLVMAPLVALYWFLTRRFLVSQIGASNERY
jgi:iron(III) transport system permease protein